MFEGNIGSMRQGFGGTFDKLADYLKPPSASSSSRASSMRRASWCSAMWTDPRHAMRWWGPKRHPAVHVEMDVKPGGRWRNLRSPRDRHRALAQRHLPRGRGCPIASSSPSSGSEEGERCNEKLVTVTFADEGSRYAHVAAPGPVRSCRA